MMLRNGSFIVCRLLSGWLIMTILLKHHQAGGIPVAHLTEINTFNELSTSQSLLLNVSPEASFSSSLTPPQHPSLSIHEYEKDETTQLGMVNVLASNANNENNSKTEVVLLDWNAGNALKKLENKVSGCVLYVLYTLHVLWNTFFSLSSHLPSLTQIGVKGFFLHHLLPVSLLSYQPAYKASPSPL